MDVAAVVFLIALPLLVLIGIVVGHREAVADRMASRVQIIKRAFVNQRDKEEGDNGSGE